MPAWFEEHGGSVLSTTIDKYLYITLREMPPFWDFKNRFVYGSKTELVQNIEETEHPSIRETIKFLKITKGIDLHYNTDIPARSGMGSSSAFTVGLLNALYGLGGKMVSSRRLASEAIHIEQDLIGEAVGVQDQIAAAFGGFNQMAFRKDGTFEVRPMTLPKARLTELNQNLLLLFTGFQRFAAQIEKEKIRTLKSHTQELTDMERYVHDAVEVLNTNAPIAEFGALLDETWQRKRRLSDKVSLPEIDKIYETGLKNGAVGGKLLGAGGGGFLLFFVPPDKREALLAAMRGFVHIPFAFDLTGSQTIYYREGV